MARSLANPAAPRSPVSLQVVGRDGGCIVTETWMLSIRIFSFPISDRWKDSL